MQGLVEGDDENSCDGLKSLSTVHAPVYFGVAMTRLKCRRVQKEPTYCLDSVRFCVRQTRRQLFVM
jgi:hypothetical protein